MHKFTRIALLYCTIIAIILSVAIADEEISLKDLSFTPSVYIVLPETVNSYENGGKLKVVATGKHVKSYRVSLSWEGNRLVQELNGEQFESIFEFEPTHKAMELSVVGFTEENFSGNSTEVMRQVISPKQEIILKMIDLAFKNSKEKQYKFAPAEEDHQIGVCKNFVMRLFDTFSKDYRMSEYPDLVLHMPKNKSLIDSKPYQYGLEWRDESAEDGSPFEIAGQFKYDRDLSKEENFKKAYELMLKIQKGDFFQMVGDYGGGNGPHSLYFIEDYDAATDNLHFTDSNMFGKRIDGVRWGYMQYDAVRTGNWFATVFNMRDRGATIYRLRDDLIKP
ncbi:MAG: hypothetical protein GYA87_04115 [Christensenellaceae bacterium]|nr:hypothetical protein [Christensenellaceae bacterium]